MLARDVISEDVPPIRPNESINKALVWMDDFKVSHLPVVDGKKFIGILSEDDILGLPHAEDCSVKDCEIELKKIFVTENQHVFDVIKTISDFHLTVIPIIRDNDEYIGCVTNAHLMHVIAEMSVVRDLGGIIELEMNVRDYYFSQIARVIEENDAKILGAFITSPPDTTKMNLTIKVNTYEIDGIIQSFERLGYTVVGSYGSNVYDEDFRERLDEFFKYLNI
ncbi:MAG: CBS domain-containing protein [Bacteroidetes bacterium]|nr:MAG: CBS domain-containing protein [Bacteroidota bacterium]